MIYWTIQKDTEVQQQWEEKMFEVVKFARLYVRGQMVSEKGLSEVENGDRPWWYGCYTGAYISGRPIK